MPRMIQSAYVLLLLTLILVHGEVFNGTFQFVQMAYVVVNVLSGSILKIKVMLTCSKRIKKGNETNPALTIMDKFLTES
jgi:hypothetical protein